MTWAHTVINHFYHYLENLPLLPRGSVYFWSNHVYLDASCDLGIAIACFSLPIFYLRTRKIRQDIRRDPYLYRVYGGCAAVFTCGGLVFLMNLITMWVPIYWILTILKLMGLVVISGFAYGLIPSLPEQIMSQELQFSALMKERANLLTYIKQDVTDLGKIKSDMLANPSNIQGIIAELEEVIERLKLRMVASESTG